MFADLFRQNALEIDRPFERYDDRDLKIIEQADKVSGVGLDFGAEPLVHLRQEETLEIDDHTAATIGDNPLHRFHVVVRPMTEAGQLIGSAAAVL